MGGFVNFRLEGFLALEDGGLVLEGERGEDGEAAGDARGEEDGEVVGEQTVVYVLVCVLSEVGSCPGEEELVGWVESEGSAETSHDPVSDPVEHRFCALSFD